MPERSLKSSRDFERVLRTGRRGSSGGLIVHASPRPDGGSSRLGLVVRSGAAVERNRAKRRLRAAFASACPASGYDVVIKSGAPAAEPFGELSKHLARALEDATGGGR